MDHQIVHRLLLAALLLAGLGTGTASALTWQSQTVDSEGNVGWYPSLALDAGGNPRIAYRDLTNADLKYAARNGPAWEVEVVDPAGGMYSSLALDAAGAPRIGYWGNLGLTYAARNATGWTIETVDPAGGAHASLELNASGNPCISYYDSASADLKYAWHDGSIWQIETADSAGSVGRDSSLALDAAGNPHISYRDFSNSDLKYAWRDGDGWHNVTVDPGGSRSVGRDTSIALDGAGHPHISYYDETSVVLRYAWHDGTAWQLEQVDLAWSGWCSSLALDAGGSPRITYHYLDTPPNNMKLRYAWRDGGGWHTEAVTSGGYVESYTSLALDADGRPRISYYDKTNVDLVFAWAGPVPPVADFSANVTSGAVPLAVGFTDASAHGPTAWSWEFGDGGTSTEQNPVHVYEAAGSFTVNLTATNADSSDTATKPAFITVVQPFLGAPAPPTDTDGDGLYDDVNGNGRPDFADVVLYFNLMDWIAGNEPVGCFDYNENGRIDFADVVWLFNNL
jgi:hypothetical protein